MKHPNENANTRGFISRSIPLAIAGIAGTAAVVAYAETIQECHDHCNAGYWSAMYACDHCTDSCDINGPQLECGRTYDDESGREETAEAAWDNYVSCMAAAWDGWVNCVAECDGNYSSCAANAYSSGESCYGSCQANYG